MDRLLEETPARLFEEWRALYDLEPWADERLDYAVGTSIMHNVAAHGISPREPIAYMPFLKKEEPIRQREEDMKAVWNAICTVMSQEVEAKE